MDTILDEKAGRSVKTTAGDEASGGTAVTPKAGAREEHVFASVVRAISRSFSFVSPTPTSTVKGERQST